nr:site-specific integrase [Desulfobulbus alkaliphilus]
MKKDGYAPATIRHQTILLSRLYTLADRWGLYGGQNPCKRAKRVQVNNQVTERLDEEQLARLMDVLESWPCRASACLVKFLLFTGIRKGEEFKLIWKDIDMQQKLMKLRDPKGGRDVSLPLSDKALAVLKEVPRVEDSLYVFPGKDGQQREWFYHPWARIRKMAGLPNDFRLHGLRHAFASAMVCNGVDLFIVSRLLTHKDISTTQRYAHLSDQSLRDALKVSDRCQTPQDSNVVPLRKVAQ